MKCKVDIIELYHKQHIVTFLTKFISARLESDTWLSRIWYGNN